MLKKPRNEFKCDRKYDGLVDEIYHRLMADNCIILAFQSNFWSNN